jgi:hypothetical protein
MPPSLSAYGVRRGSVPDLPRQRPKPCAVAGTTSRPSPDVQSLPPATRQRGRTPTRSSTSWWPRQFSGAICSRTRRDRSRAASASATPLLGRAKFTTASTVPVHLQQCSRRSTRPEHSWRWRESNPRPSAAHQGFSGCSLLQFSQPQRSRRQDAAGSVTVWFPYRPRDRGDRWSPLSMPGPRARAHLG